MWLVHLYGGLSICRSMASPYIIQTLGLHSVCNECIWVKCWILMCCRRIGLWVDHWPMAVLWSRKAQTSISNFAVCSELICFCCTMLPWVQSSRSHITEYIYCKKEKCLPNLWIFNCLISRSLKSVWKYGHVWRLSSSPSRHCAFYIW